MVGELALLSPHKKLDGKGTNDLFIVFTVGSKSFALPVKSVLTVIQSVKIRAVEGLSENILGVVNFHGEIVPVLNLYENNEDLKSALSATSSLIIIFEPEERKLGALVDSVENVIRLSENQMYSEQSNLTQNKLLQLIVVENGIIVLKNLCGQIDENQQSILDKLAESQGEA